MGTPGQPCQEVARSQRATETEKCNDWGQSTLMLQKYQQKSPCMRTESSQQYQPAVLRAAAVVSLMQYLLNASHGPIPMDGLRLAVPKSDPV